MKETTKICELNRLSIILAKGLRHNIKRYHQLTPDERALLSRAGSLSFSIGVDVHNTCLNDIETRLNRLYPVNDLNLDFLKD